MFLLTWFHLKKRPSWFLVLSPGSVFSESVWGGSPGQTGMFLQMLVLSRKCLWEVSPTQPQLTPLSMPPLVLYGLYSYLPSFPALQDKLLQDFNLSALKGQFVIISKSRRNGILILNKRSTSCHPPQTPHVPPQCYKPHLPHKIISGSVKNNPNRSTALWISSV